MGYHNETSNGEEHGYETKTGAIQGSRRIIANVIVKDALQKCSTGCFKVDFNMRLAVFRALYDIGTSGDTEGLWGGVIYGHMEL